MKIHMLLSRILDAIQEYPGLVVLLCHIDGPQHVSLQRLVTIR